MSEAAGRTLRGLAMSNIAWEPAEDHAVAKVLRASGFRGVEVAPTKRWPSPIEATKREISEYRAQWEARGLRIVALQSLLFGRPDLQLFGNAAGRRVLHEYMVSMVDMAFGLGATALVFGSPKNRLRGTMPLDDANEIACEFFRELGAVAMTRGCVLCIEPNPPTYGCDFINTTAEAVAFVEAVRSRGVKVQGDMGAILTTGEDVESTISAAAWLIGHFHVSETELAEISSIDANEAAADALRAGRYAGWVSIEMRASTTGSRVDAIARTVQRVVEIYGS